MINKIREHAALIVVALISVSVLIFMQFQSLPELSIKIDGDNPITIVVFEGELRCPGSLERIGDINTEGVYYMRLRVACEAKREE